jgi:hypothetical protein
LRTPAGTECRYYYEDFHRGRQTQECRLIERTRRSGDSLPWTPDLCEKCNVPAIIRANGSKDLRLKLSVQKRFGLFKSLKLVVRCAAHDEIIADPMRGCARCLEAGSGSGSGSALPDLEA